MELCRWPNSPSNMSGRTNEHARDTDRGDSAGDTLLGWRVPRIGLVWMGLSAFLYATASLFARFSNDIAGASSWQVVFFRCCVQWALATTYAAAVDPAVDLWGPPTARIFLVARGFVGVGGLSCFYFAVSRLPLSDATVLMFTSPVWTCGLAWATLGERIGPHELASVVVSMAGVCFIAKPTFLFGRAESATENARTGGDGGGDGGDGGDRTLAIAVGLMGSVFAASAHVVIRKMKAGVHYMTVVHAFAVAGMIVSPVFILVMQRRPLLSHSRAWKWEFLCGVAGFLAQCFMSRGLQLERAGPASLMRNVDVLFAFVFQFAFIGAGDITALSLAGAACIMASAALTAAGGARDKEATSPVPTPPGCATPPLPTRNAGAVSVEPCV